MVIDGDDNKDGNRKFELNSLDKRILELNKQGLSGGQISKILNEEGRGLTTSSVCRRLTEMRQDPDNGVQVNYKSFKKVNRTETKWYNIILKLKEMIADYIRRKGRKPSSRTMFYDLQDLGILRPEDEGSFIRHTVYARLKWTDTDGNLKYPELDIDCFEDTWESRKTIDNYDDSEPQEPGPPGEIPDPYENIDEYITILKKTPKNYEGVGEEGEPAEIGGRWYEQPEYVEVWEEKNDLLPDFKEILEDREIIIRANKGYSSLEFLFVCTERLKEMMQMKGFKPEHIHILYCGDCDPSGMDIDYYIKRRLKQLGISGIDFKRIAVTPEQIKKYHLPLMALQEKNPNTKEYKLLYGDKATHLNAFFTKKHEKQFKEILLNEVDKHWDESIYIEMVEKYEAMEPEDPPSMDQKELEETRQNMVKRITEAFKPGWEKEYDDDDADDNS